MASSRGSLNQADVVDLVAVMEAFEEMNQVVLTLTGRVETVADKRQLVFLFQAHDKEKEIGEVPSLASVRCVIGLRDHKTLESAFLWSLYRIDGELAKVEFRKGATEA